MLNLRMIKFFRDIFKVNKPIGRKDYWLTMLQLILFNFILIAISMVLSNKIFFISSQIIMVIGSLTMFFRRIFDTGLSPLKIFIFYIISMLLTSLILLIPIAKSSPLSIDVILISIFNVYIYCILLSKKGEGVKITPSCLHLKQEKVQVESEIPEKEDQKEVLEDEKQIK